MSEHSCENCGKNFEELVTREGFCQTYFIEWVCLDCFRELEGLPHSNYTEDVHYERNS